MTTLAQLKKNHPEFEWKHDNTGSYFASISGISIDKVINKTRYHFDNVYIYISSPLYKGTENEFRYAICYQKSTYIPYRCKRERECEYGKVYVSGKTIKDIVKELSENIRMNTYYLSK